MLVFLVIAAVVLLYSQGYSLDRNFNFSQKGGLYISAQMPNSDIFVNNKKKKATGMLNSGLFLSNLKTGKYSILVAKENFWPWAKTLEVKKGFVTEARAIMVPQNPSGEILFKGKFSNIWSSPHHELLVLKEQKNSIYHLTFYMPKKNTFLTADSAFTENLLSFKGNISDFVWENDYVVFKSDKGLVKADFYFTNDTVAASYFSGSLKEFSDFERYSKRKDEKIWWNPKTNEIFVDWLKKDSLPPYYICEEICELPLLVFKGGSVIKNVDFFPKRKDVIIVAIGNGIYALEIDGRGGRLIYPIYKGKDPTFAQPRNGDSVYIMDDGALIKISLK
jgi:hypothetical protein